MGVEGVRIEGVAIQASKSIHYSAAPPKRHHHLIAELNERGISPKNMQQGFITSDRMFVDRVEAMTIARAANQLKPEVPSNKRRLFSEDLW